jgi:pilus assembly protein FimV
MIITCEACNTSFDLDAKMLKPTGSKVRCSVCANVFTAFPPQEPATLPTDDVAAPEAVDDAPSPAESDGRGEVESADVSEPDRSGDDAGTPFEKDTVAVDDEQPDLSETVLVDLDEDEAPDLGETVIVDFDEDEAPDLDETVIVDFDEDEAPDLGETVVVDLDDEDFDLDVPPAADDEQDNATMVITDLDDDAFSLDFEEGTEATEAGASGETGDDLDLSLDLDLDGDAPVTEDAKPDAADAGPDELSLDFDLEADEETGETASGDAAGDDDLELALDLEGEGAEDRAKKEAAPAIEDDLDLSGLEGLLEDESFTEDTEDTVADEGEEPELTLEPGDDTGDSSSGDLLPVDETLEDLEIELDEADKTDDLKVEGAETADQEIDLSEIEKMLEEPKAGDAKAGDVPDQDLDLDIEASLGTEKWMSESLDEDALVGDEELDLSELEQVLEDVDSDVSDDTVEDQELDFDLRDEETHGESGETVEVDKDLDFDLSDFEDDTPVATIAEEVSRDPDDMELEFEVEEGEQGGPSLADEGMEETVVVPEALEQEPNEEVPEQPAEAAVPEPEPEPKPAKKTKPAKKGVSKSLVFLLIVVILGGAVYGTYYMLNQSGIEIPFLSDYLKPKVQDPGNLQMTTYDINSKFIDNATSGKLFVISGKVKNGYSDNRGMISIVGKIFSSGKQPIQQTTVYCGNVMSDLELANLEWDKITARLANRLGDNRSNVKIEPGKSIPFMVVFSNLPDNLEEFTIEVVGSTSLK